MKTIGFKRTFMSGLMGFGYSSKVIAEEKNKVEEEAIAITEAPTADKPKTNFL